MDNSYGDFGKVQLWCVHNDSVKLNLELFRTV